MSIPLNRIPPNTGLRTLFSGTAGRRHPEHEHEDPTDTPDHNSDWSPTQAPSLRRITRPNTAKACNDTCPSLTNRSGTLAAGQKELFFPGMTLPGALLTAPGTMKGRGC